MPVAGRLAGKACQKQEFQVISNDVEAATDINNIDKTVTGAACGLLQIMRITAIATVPNIMGDMVLGYHKPITLNVPELQ